MDQHVEEKKAAGYAAANLIKEGMVVGLGTGSTARFFIDALAEKMKNGLLFSVVASSKQSFDLAKNHGLNPVDIESIKSIDITVDGADVIDENHNLIKGGGGAHLREKVLANLSKKFVVIADPSKFKQNFDGEKLPIEITPFAHTQAARQIENIAAEGMFRKNGSGSLFVTDNGNYVFDIILPTITNLEKLHLTLLAIPGVVETGLFLGMATTIITGHRDGSTTVIVT